MTKIDQQWFYLQLGSSAKKFEEENICTQVCIMLSSKINYKFSCHIFFVLRVINIGETQKCLFFSFSLEERCRTILIHLFLCYSFHFELKKKSILKESSLTKSEIFRKQENILYHLVVYLYERRAGKTIVFRNLQSRLLFQVLS